MPRISTSTAAVPAELYVHDTGGSGRPVVLIHGWPLSHRMWEPQVRALVLAGYRVVAYDRRGFGESSRPAGGYDYDTFADDLRDVMEELDLRDAALVGFSMGGGEVARYVGRYGSERVRQVAFVSSVTPYLQQADDNPDGVPPHVFEDMRRKIREDRAAFLRAFGKTFFGVGVLSQPVSDEQLDYAWSIAVMADPVATHDCVTAFAETDFRADLAKVSVPALVVHGAADKTVPIGASGERTAGMVTGARSLVFDGAPHGLYLTHTERFNEVLLDFLDSGAATPAAPAASEPTTVVL